MKIQIQNLGIRPQAFVMIAALAAIGTAAFFLTTRIQNANLSAPIPSPDGNGLPVGVEALMGNPSQYTGPINVAGVVSAVSPRTEMLGLIDIKEFTECGTTMCPDLTLPVRWNGPMPQVNDEIMARGQIENAHGKLIFVASALEKRPLAKPGDHR